MNLLRNIRKHPHLIGEMINIYLIHKNIRLATLIETQNENFRNNIRDNLKVLKDLIRGSKLKMLKIDDSPDRYLISKSGTYRSFKQAIKDGYYRTNFKSQING